MGICKNCRHWTQSIDQSTELFLDAESALHPQMDGYGRCLLAKSGAPMLSKYDGGWVGELLTREDFGCNQFEQRDHEKNCRFQN